VQIDRGKREQLIDLGAYLIGLAFGLGVLVAPGYGDWPGDALGRSDLAKFWAGPRALLLGRDPYDAGTWVDPTHSSWVRLWSPGRTTHARLGTSAGQYSSICFFDARSAGTRSHTRSSR